MYFEQYAKLKMYIFRFQNSVLTRLSWGLDILNKRFNLRMGFDIQQLGGLH